MTNIYDHRYLANAIRALAMDSVQKANSGHPGMPMGMADIAEVLWNHELKHNPTNPNWSNRDRFVVSNGHGAMLLYALLHLAGYDLPINELINFRQLNSKTPGHPEFAHTPGVETTTGPLGQGIANAVGMALAESMLASEFNRDGFNIVDHHTYAFTGDGGLMEGISHEVCSLAGTWGLGKLILFWDDNGISIDGDVQGWFTDNTPERFNAYGWQVITDVDGHNAASIQRAIQQAKQETGKPTLICCKTKIGFGSPNKQGTAGAHGAPLGDDEIAKTREQLGWTHKPFDIPEDVYAAWDARERGRAYEDEWNVLFAKYEQQYPELASEFLRRQQRHLPDNFAKHSEQFIQNQQDKAAVTATRKASKSAIDAYAPMLPELVGGSADLTGSNCTAWSGSKVISRDDKSGNYIEYGVREFGMSAIMNGMALHRGFIPFGGTFLVFSDYARNAIRLSAMMQQPVIYVLTHDSIGLGEDGPTHQPIEHAAMLRMTPNLSVWRPCDTVETAVAWQQAIESQSANCLLLTRQNVAHQTRNEQALANIKRGGYVLWQGSDDDDVILIATGSEVELAVTAAQQLQQDGVHCRVVSMPCADVFKAQDAAYRESVLPSSVEKRIAIEAGASDYWWQFVGLRGQVIGIDRFGMSAPYQQIYKALGITVEHIVQTAQALAETCMR